MKFACGLLMPTLAYSYASLGERSEIFGEPSHEPVLDDADLRDAEEPVYASGRGVVEQREELVGALRSLATHCREIAAMAPGAWDEATRGEILRLLAMADSACAVLAQASCVDDSQPHPDAVAPSRSARLTVAPLGIDFTRPSAEDNMPRRLHNFAFGTELGALELCAENILMASSMPREFVVDMAVQCFDEARHAVALLARLAAYGKRDDSYPVSLNLWNRSRSLSLPQRLAVHQRNGEWIGFDALIATANDYLSRGDLVTCNLMRFMARDEVRHIGYGNKWLRWFEERGFLIVEEIDQWADEYRGTYGDAMASASARTVNEQGCLDAGFNLKEIARLKRARGQGE
jgi:uncharacterized ferritin-like protein (DUF455 family)